jgi:hypothetical protein
MVDLCSMANISIFFFDSPLHGYYIHGKNPLNKSDTDIEGLMDILKKEANQKATKRGLQPRHSNDELARLQTFEIFIPTRLRVQYDKVGQTLIRSSIRSKTPARSQKTPRKKARRKSRAGLKPKTKTMTSCKMLKP